MPWESTSLESDVFLFPAARKLTEAELEAEIQRELDTWNRVKGSKETNEWAAFLRDNPSGRKGDVLTVEFTVAGGHCLGLNGGPEFTHNEAFSFQITTDDQSETDRYWNAIVGNGQSLIS